MATEWGRTTVLVHDMDAARDFYRAAFGFRTILDSAAAADAIADGETAATESTRVLHLGFTGSDAGVWLVQAEGGDALRVGRQAGAAPLGVLYVDDVDASLRKAVSAGARMLGPVDSDATSRFARVRDLYGNEIVLAQPNKRKSATPKSATAATATPKSATAASRSAATPTKSSPKSPPKSARPPQS